MNVPAFLGQVRLASPITFGWSWWRHHILNTRAYAEAVFSKDVSASISALHELWLAVKDWEQITGNWSAGLLMAEHTAIAKLLVDCLAAGDSSCARVAADALGRNVEAQRKLFPREAARFAELFAIHTTLAGTYITDLSEGRMNDFERDFSQALENGQSLGQFTDQVFSRIR